MSKIVFGLFGLLYVILVIYIFSTGTVALGVMLSIIGLVLIPLVTKIAKGEINITSVPDPKAYSDPNSNSEHEK